MSGSSSMAAARRSRIASGVAAAITLLGAVPGAPAWAQTAPSGGAGLTPMDDRAVRATVLRGTPPAHPIAANRVQVLPTGDIVLNFPGVDVQAVAKAILGDTLGLPFAVDPSVHGAVTVKTTHPIRRADVLGFLEQSLTSANMVLANQAGTYTILASATARSQAPVVGPEDQGFGNETINLKFVNAEELRKLLDPIVPNAITVSDPVHNVLVVSGNSTQRRSLRELVAQFDVDWLRGMSFGLYIPQRTDARLIAPELEQLLNAPGAQSAGLVRLIAMDRLNGILAITAQPQYLDDVRRFVEILDREGESTERRVFVYHVENGRASDMAKVLNAAFGNAQTSGSVTDTEPTELVDHTSPSPSTQPPPPGFGYGAGATGVAGAGGFPTGLPPRATAAGAQVRERPEHAAGSPPGSEASGTTITADETNNAIVVFATPRDYALVEDALRKLDVPPLQVMIDASISEVTLNHTLQYGIQWSFEQGPNIGALTQGTTSTPVQNFPGFSYLYSGLGGNLQATLNALATVTDVTVLSAPKLMVLNNHTATIEVGDQVPISTGSAVSTLTTGAPIVNSVEYRDTGIILKITPRVNAGGLVLLDIAQEVSDVLPLSAEQESSGIDSPTIEERKFSTSVAVQDGETVALGGLIKNEVQKGRSSVPLLGNIPILGHLFGDTTGALIRTELVVLLTPHVVRTATDAAAITAELRAKLHEAPAPPPPKPNPKAKANGAGGQ